MAVWALRLKLAVYYVDYTYKNDEGLTHTKPKVAGEWFQILYKA